MITMIANDKYVHCTYHIFNKYDNYGHNYVLKVRMSSFTCQKTICAAHFSTATTPVATAAVKSLCSSTKINKVETALLNYI